MKRFPLFRQVRAGALTGTALVLLGACQTPMDFDMRGINGGFSTANAAQVGPTADRPQPDSRGVISYPNYQVAVAGNGDTIQSIASRLNLSAPELARYNGVEVDVPLRRGEVIALPSRVSESSSAIATGPVQPGGVDINSLAGNAINRAPETPGVQTAALPPAQAAPVVQSGSEPARHKVERGETAFTIARLYQVPVKSLAEWNGLGSDFAIREGQYLLIPVPQQNAPKPVQTAAVPLPGTGSPTPTPPSAAKPLPPVEAATPVAQPETPAAPVANVGPQTASSSAKLAFPVSGSIIREYSKGKSEGIDIKAAAGTAVKSADAGTVAAITQSADGVPIVVVRHDDNLLTVYANVTDVSVAKGDQVSRGQSIAKLRSGNDAYVHFEVRKGFDSVDPLPYLQ